MRHKTDPYIEQPTGGGPGGFDAGGRLLLAYSESGGAAISVVGGSMRAARMQ